MSSRQDDTMKILVVEDSRTQAESLKYILEKKGWKVWIATNGKLALGSLAADRPDLVLTDIMMPEMDGYELCRSIRGDEKTKSIPVIMVTQLFDPIDVVRGLEAGADNFIIKPYEPEDIYTRIGHVLDAARNENQDGGNRPLTIVLPDGVHTITSGRVQILNILLSTYEIAVRKNNELLEAQERISLVNDKLQLAVSDLGLSNTRLSEENTERVRVEKALAESNKKLHLMTSITRHDILNQLTAMQGYLELAAVNWDTDRTRTRENVRNAETIVNQTINTINFTAEYQKIGVKSPAWKNIRSLVDHAAKESRPGAIRIENEVPAGMEIFADPLIEKVFFNLIDNAIRYGVKLTRITFRGKRHDDSLTIVCEDDGVGVAPDEKEKIFSYEYGMNTGLGLFLSREILAITGIRIHETGTPGEGARFEMLCPGGTVRETGEQK